MTYQSLQNLIKTNIKIENFLVKSIWDHLAPNFYPLHRPQLGVHRDQPRPGVSGDPGTFSPGRRDRDFRILSRRPGPGPGFKIKPVHHSLKSIVCRFWMQMSILIDITLILSTEHLLLTHNLFLPVFYPLDLATFSRNQTPFTKSTRHSYYK